MSQTVRHAALRTLLPGFAGASLPDWLGELLDDGLGGVCLFGPNLESPEQTRRLTAEILAANPHALIAVDEEGGDVTRLSYRTGAPYPGNALLGRLGDLALTERTARAVGWQLREAGVNVDFAPDADVNSNPDNPVIGVRSFGADPGPVADHVAAWVSGLQAAGVAATAKHFPGHGDTAQDSHLALPVVDRSAAELSARELVPFRAAIEAGAKLVMTSHLLLPQLDAESPATMSEPVLEGLLRGELGFHGVVVSDALDMAGASAELGIPAAAVRALAAGVDLLCVGTDNAAEQLEQIVAAVEAAVASGELDAGRLTDASARVSRLAVELATARETTPLPAAGSHEPVYDLAQLAGGFDVSDAARAWLSVGGPYRLARVESESNLAVGIAPWGPFAAGAREELLVTPGSALVDPGEGRLVVVGRDLHRHGHARDFIAAARRRGGASVLVVDMGWPSDDRRFADIATFGASRLVGRALLELLGGAR
ncbi:glycoside hydrolase family 3 protein [Gryllotalpicola ginsengisoli]|uniref:glycoside hydrolase family 3 protein n=1 Tax=Gryllotalpicola ginsengisoli TaxID=444608 RepID=UPI0003B32D0E|nr:glycoside hydrolase family 3 N-terminal domain-containing protein [Gryllotalpicola ginsengisoli]